ncbi:MAG: glycoside hydrolase family protein [Vampirovibrionales bacterium]
MMPKSFQNHLKKVWDTCFQSSSHAENHVSRHEADTNIIEHLCMWLLSEEDADLYEDSTLFEALHHIQKQVHCDLNDIQWSAILSYYLRVGETTFQKSSVRRALNERNLYQVEQALLQYTGYIDPITRHTLSACGFNFKQHSKMLHRCYLEHQAFIGYEDECHKLEASPHSTHQSGKPRWIAESPHASTHMRTNPTTDSKPDYELQTLLEALNLKIEKMPEHQAKDMLNGWHPLQKYKVYETLDEHPQD